MSGSGLQGGTTCVGVRDGLRPQWAVSAVSVTEGVVPVMSMAVKALHITSQRWIPIVMGGHEVLQMVMWQLILAVCQLCISKVSGSFGGSTECGQQLDPSHGERKWNSSKLRFTSVIGNHDSQLEGVIWSKKDAIKSIGQVILGQEQRAFSRICMVDEPKQSRQCTTKLHDFMG